MDTWTVKEGGWLIKCSYFAQNFLIMTEFSPNIKVFLRIYSNREEGGARNIKIDIKKAKNIQNMFDYTNHTHTHKRV